MKVGASYYPELSDRSQWERDLNAAREIGLRALRCGEFAGSRLMPEPGKWDADWARQFLDLAGGKGFDVIWCTPSATPPPYLFDKWPGLEARNQDNQPVPQGVRRNYCPSHAGYRQFCVETASRLAEEFDNHPAIVGWQVDNELAGDGFTCWCSRCGEAFQGWLKERYRSLDVLNAAWKTDVWAQRYTDWRQIPVPHTAFGSHAPSLKLAWRRFRSDNWQAFYRIQAQALKCAGVSTPVTTNFYNLSWDVPFDRWTWRHHMDVIGISHYLEDETASRFELSLLRGLDEKPLWVLEQKAGQQLAQNLYPEDLGRLERHLRLCAEAGADYAIYWHLRQHAAGCEMEHGAVLRHDGKPTRIAHAIKSAITEVSSHMPGARSAQAVLVFDFHQHWAQECRPQAGAPLNYRATLEQDWFGALNDAFGSTAVTEWNEALENAEIVAAPHWQMISDSQIDQLRLFLQKGGIFITTADFGRLNEDNNVRPTPPLSALSSLASMPDGEMLHLKPDFAVEGEWNGHRLTGRHFWFVPEVIPLSSPLSDGHLHGPALLDIAIGSGRVIVLLCAYDRPSLTGLLTDLLQGVSSEAQSSTYAMA